LKVAEAEAAVGSEDRLDALAAPFQPIIWDEEDVRAGHGSPGRHSDASEVKGTTSRKEESFFWRVCFQAGLLALIFANVSIELGEWFHMLSVLTSGVVVLSEK
jgi:hypothetical protein